MSIIKWRFFVECGDTLEPKEKEALLAGQFDFCLGLIDRPGYSCMQKAIERDNAQLFSLLLDRHSFWDYQIPNQTSSMSKRLFTIFLEHPSTDYFHSRNVECFHISLFDLSCSYGFTSIYKCVTFYNHNIAKLYKALSFIPKMIQFYRLLWNNKQVQDNPQKRLAVFLVVCKRLNGNLYKNLE